MKKFVLTVALLALCASPSFGADRLGLFADTNGSQCNITVPVSTQFSVYVLHLTADGATASEFQVTNPANATMLSIGNDLGSANYIAIGDPFSGGVSVAYTACMMNTFVVYNLKFLALAPQANCIYMTLGPDSENKLLVTDCNYIEIQVPTAQAILNPQASCDCDVPTQETTWGKVKSLYR